MGWHTLKRQKSAQKAAQQQQQQQQKQTTSNTLKQSNSFKEEQNKNFKNLTIKTPSPATHFICNNNKEEEDIFSSTKDHKVQTLLARAVYDNHADAPDELTIRKGDIVTVIEKDIDGLTGWWLCLLHGQQGIVPGNRLKVIPSLELDQFERKSVSTKKRASYETDDNSDSHDALDGIPHNYDYLPNPVKTPAFIPQLSIKDMFDIPLKNPDSDKRSTGNVSQELYDVPSSLNTTLDTTQEIYDIPSNRSSNNLNQSTSSIPTEYDSPRSARKQIVVENQETYDIPSHLTNQRQPPKQPQPYKVPVVALNASNEIYDEPKSKSSIAVDQLMGEIMDSPFNSDSDMSTIKRSPSSNHSNNSSPRSSYTPSTEEQELYDVPKKDNLRLNLHLKNSPSNTMSRTLPRGFSPRNKNLAKGAPTRLQEIYDIPSSTTAATNNRSLPGTPLSNRKINETFDTQQQIYDIPAPRNNDPTSNPEFLSMLRQLERQDQQHSTSNRSSLSSNLSSNNNRISQELNDIPNGSSSNRSSVDASVSSYQNTRNEYTNIKVQQEIYDVPHSKTKRYSGGQLTQPNQTSTPRDQEIYDVPPSSARTPNTKPTTRISHQEIYDIPPNSKNSSQQEIYDIPPNSKNSSQQEIYDIPPNSRNSSQQEIYDIPPNSKNFSQQEIYDVPSAHDVNKVMAEAYDSHKTNRNFNNNNNNNNLLIEEPDDDYVDYYDIWNKEPPKELLQQHVKNITTTATVETTSNRPPSGGFSSMAQKRLSGSDNGKKSVLDQINFEAVKELQLTVSEALDRLAKLHLAVDTCVQTLKCFHDGNWLDISSLKAHLPAIRDFSGKLKTALRLLTEFGLGTLVNTTNNINGEALMDNIIGDVEPLLECYYKIKICLMHLDSNNWTIPSVRDSTNDKFFATLNAIMILAQRIPDQCRAFTLAVQNNASELFTPDQVKEINSPNAPPPQTKVQFLSEPPMSAEALRKELAGRRQQARETTLRPVPRIPPKPNLPNQRRSLAGVMDMQENSPRYNLLANRGGYGHIERLVTDYQPENSKQKKYASDPTTPSHTTSQNTIWGGSCPVLLDRNSAAAATPIQHHIAESTSSSSSVAASIPEEAIEIKQTTTTTDVISTKINFPSDSNLTSPILTPMHTRSASLPWDDKLKNVFTFDDNSGGKASTISPLDHRDIESLEFFCRQVESQVLLLRESMKNLTETVENREEPVIFVSHSKFIILTAHKVVHSGQEISERLINTEIKSKIKENTAHLTVCIRGVVAATKTAALEFPEPNALMEMISSVLALGDAVRIVHGECRQALNA